MAETWDVALAVVERRARQGCQSSSALNEVLVALDALRALAAKVEAVEALLADLGPVRDTHRTHSENCHTWHIDCLLLRLRAVLGTPEGEAWQPGDPLPEPLQPTVEIGGQVMTQAQFAAARHPLLTVDPGPTVAGDAMEVNSDTPEGEKTDD